MSDPSFLRDLENSIASGTVNQRLRALKRVTDLFTAGSARYSIEQIALFDDVLMKLAELVETEARARLARRLATLPDAPPRMIRTLAFDPAIEVAGPVLSKSERLEEPDLVENARTQSQDHLYAISLRRELSEAVTDVLVDRGDRRVVRSVAGNVGARFSENGMEKLVARAHDDETLAERLGLRHDIPRHQFLKLLHTASARVRKRLASHAPSAAAVQRAVAEATETISREVREASPEFKKAKRASKRRYTSNQLGENNVHAAATSQNFDKTVATLALLGRFPVELVERGLLDENPDILLILAKAAGCSRLTTKALMLMRVAGRGMSAHDIEAALTSFDRLSAPTANRIINYYVKRQNSAGSAQFRSAVATSMAAVA
jgi:uncharacterized protein (DUF2336 family)